MTKFFYKIKKNPTFGPFPQIFMAKKLSQNIQHPQLDKGFYYHAEIQRNLMIKFLENTSFHSRMEGQIDPISQDPSGYCRGSTKTTFFFNWDSLHARLNSHYEAWSYNKKKHKKIKACRKSVQKEPTVKRYLLILDLKPLRSQVKGKHSIGREFQSLAVRGKKLLTQASL